MTSFSITASISSLYPLLAPFSLHIFFLSTSLKHLGLVMMSTPSTWSIWLDLFR